MSGQVWAAEKAMDEQLLGCADRQIIDRRLGGRQGERQREGKPRVLKGNGRAVVRVAERQSIGRSPGGAARQWVGKFRIAERQPIGRSLICNGWAS